MVDPLHEPQQPLHLVPDLILSHEAVRIVLRELPHARKARQHTGRFVPVKRRLLVEPQRQVAIAAALAGEHQHVPGAVHGLHAHLLVVLRLHQEHVRAVVLPMARGLPQRLVEDERCLHLHVPGGVEHLAHVVRECLVEHRSLAEPERGAGRPRVEHEQAEVASELAVIAQLRLVNPGEVGLQVLVAEKGRAVDALHRRVLRVPLPVGVRGRQAA